MAPPVGATGIPDACGASSAEPPRWRASASFGLLETDLRFSDWSGNALGDATLSESTLTASLSYQLTRRTTLQLAAGAVLGGAVTTADGARDLRAGWTASFAVSHVFLQDEGNRPFVVATAGLAEASAPTHAPGAANDPTFTAIDFRLSGVVGKTFRGRYTPYAGLVLFGGPVYWRLHGQDALGTDLSHFQVLLGCSLALPRGLLAFAEVSPVGERSFAGGLGYAF